MRLRVNGEQVDVEDGLDLPALLRVLRLPAEAVAVAVDGDVVPRRLHAGWVLQEGQRVEVIRAVGGG